MICNPLQAIGPNAESRVSGPQAVLAGRLRADCRPARLCDGKQVRIKPWAAIELHNTLNQKEI